MISLRQLRYFDALARHRHFGRAATECAVTQPALSMQIRELEQQLGAVLVERRNGGVRLTETGAGVAARAKRILGETRDLVDFARPLGRPLAGGLRLGVIPTVAPYLLPRILPRLQEAHPDLHLDVHETRTEPLLAELIAGTLDAVVVALPAGGGVLETLPLFEDAFLLAAPASDPLPANARVDAAQLADRKLILLEEGHCLRDQALAFCALAQPDAAMSLGATSLTTVMQLVANGYGVTLLPEIAAEAKIRDQRVKFLRFAAPEPKRVIGLAWRATSPRRPDFVSLRKIIAEAMRVSRRRAGGGRAPGS